MGVCTRPLPATRAGTTQGNNVYETGPSRGDLTPQHYCHQVFWARHEGDPRTARPPGLVQQVHALMQPRASLHQDPVYHTGGNGAGLIRFPRTCVLARHWHAVTGPLDLISTAHRSCRSSAPLVSPDSVFSSTEVSLRIKSTVSPVLTAVSSVASIT